MANTRSYIGGVGGYVREPAYVAHLGMRRSWGNLLPGYRKVGKSYGAWVVARSIVRALVARGIPKEAASTAAERCESELGRWVACGAYRVRIVKTSVTTHLIY